MEAAGLSVGIVGLYAACRDGFNFYTNVKNAESNAVQLAQSLRIQMSILWGWSFYWEISRDDLVIGLEELENELPAKNQKIGEYLKGNRAKTEGVILALSAISDLLSDQDMLIENGIGLSDENGSVLPKSKGKTSQPLIHSSDEVAALRTKASWLQKRSRLVKRCQWVVRDRDKVKQLIREIADHNNSLYRLCPEGAFEPLKANFLSHYLPKYESSVGTGIEKSISKELPMRGDPNADAMYQAVVDLTPIRILAKRLDEPFTDAKRHEVLNLRAEEFEFFNLRDKEDFGLVMQKTNGRNVSSMALWRDRHTTEESGKAVWVEFKWHGRGSDGASKKLHQREYEDQSRLRDGILKFGALMMAAGEHSGLRTPHCHGLFEDGEYIGIVFGLPEKPGTSQAPATRQTLNSRPPVDLAALMKLKTSVPLGVRFRLARDLYESINTVHATCWVHKNIRPGSVLFFPHHANPDAGMNRWDINWQSVSLMGWKFSRYHGPRPGLDYGDPSTRVPESPPTAPWEIELDVYHHPHKQKSRFHKYEPIFDIYSLGLVLLEIGLWRPLRDYLKQAPPKPVCDSDEILRNRATKVHEYILNDLQPLLEHTCGKIYADVVKGCLEVQSTSHMDKKDKEAQHDRCLRMFAELTKRNA